MIEAYRKAVSDLQDLLFVPGMCEFPPGSPFAGSPFTPDGYWDPDLGGALLPQPAAPGPDDYFDPPRLIKKLFLRGEMVKFYRGSCVGSGEPPKVVRECTPVTVGGSNVWVTILTQKVPRSTSGSGVCIETPTAGSTRFAEIYEDEACTRRLRTESRIRAPACQ